MDNAQKQYIYMKNTEYGEPGKFWECDVLNNVYKVFYGSLITGKRVASNKRVFDSYDDAVEFMEKTIVKKIKGGYQIIKEE
jgi:predicted DNA-binding WGR domain protein